MRPLKYGEKLVQINARVPASRVKEFQDLISGQLKKYEIGGETTESLPQENKVVETTKPKWMLDAEARIKRNK